MGSLNGALSSLPAHELGATAIKAALERAKIPPEKVSEVLIGQVLTAGAGQNPARQAAMKAGIPKEIPSTGVKYAVWIRSENSSDGVPGYQERRRHCSGSWWTGKHESGMITRTLSLTQPLTCSSANSYALTHSSTHSLIHSLAHPLTHPLTHSLTIHSLFQLTHPLITSPLTQISCSLTHRLFWNHCWYRT